MCRQTTTKSLLLFDSNRRRHLHLDYTKTSTFLKWLANELDEDNEVSTVEKIDDMRASQKWSQSVLIAPWLQYRSQAPPPPLFQVALGPNWNVKALLK